MRGTELLDKMALIDPSYIEAADKQPRRNNRILRKWGAMAACLCLAAAGAFFLPGAWSTLAVSPPAASGVPAPDPEMTIRGEQESGIVPEHPVRIPGEEGYIEPAPEPPENSHNCFIVGGPDNQEISDVTPMISGYGEMSYSSDMSVTDGGTYFSQSLLEAMEHYGESVNYRVLIELFSGGIQISSGGKSALDEAQRLSDLGYTVAMETYTQTQENSGYTTVEASYYFTLHASYEQLKDFPASKGLGYSIMLYDEYFGRTLCLDSTVFNGSIQSSNELSS